MRFSIIVPVYNVEAYLPACMESLLKQDCKDMEIILVDDGSTDNSGMLCDGYQAAYPEFVRVIHQKNGGLGAARNRGMDEAKGEYLLFVDSDDWIHPDTLSILSRRVDETGADMVIFGFYYQYETRQVEGEPCALTGLPPFSLAEHPELLLESPSAWMRLCRRSVWQNSGIRFPDRVWYEDLHTTGKVLANCATIEVIPERLYLYRQREGSIMRSANLKRNLEIIGAVESLRTYFREQGLWEQYGSWIGCLAVDHMILAAQRVLMADPKAEYLPDFVGYLEKTFPGYAENPLLDRLGSRKKIALKLLQKRQYRILRWIFALRKRMRGMA